MDDPKVSANPDPQAANAGGSPDSQGKGAEPQGKVVPIHVMHEERAARQAAEQRLGELEKQMQELRTMRQPTHQPEPERNPSNDLEELWQTDARKATQTEILMAMDWRDRVLSKESNEFDTARNSYADFNKYEGKVRQYISSIPMGQRGKDGLVESAYFMLRGQDVDNIIKSREEELARKYSQMGAAASLPGGASSAGFGVSEDKLTDEEIRVAAAMGMKPEEYAQHKKGQ